jgi:membrane fusion protein (multidrug efflux system)
MAVAMRRKKLIAATAVAIAVCAAAAGYALFRQKAGTAPTPSQVAQQNAPPPEISLSGRIDAPNTVDVPAPVEGKILAFHADVGADVYEGQLLAEIRSESLETAQLQTAAELERAQSRVRDLESAIAAARLEASRASADAMRVRSELDRASRAYERQRLLIAEGATPRQVFEKAEKDYEALVGQAKDLETVARGADERVSSLSRELDGARVFLEDKLADAEAAKTRVEAGQVLAPASGTISARRGQEGGEVHPSMPDLFRIATDTSHLQVILEPDPAQLQRIQPGQDAAITIADVPEVLGGKVVSMQEGKVLVEFANPSPLVKPGHTAQVRIRVT